MQTTTPVESALAVIVPEVETLVAPFRSEHDPSAAAGIPAHVTVLYPFKSPAEITTETIETLETLFANICRFDVSFSESRHLLRILYLAPVPDEPFKRMTEQVYERFPETPPYAGQFADIIPHLTVAQNDDATRLQKIGEEFNCTARGVLPIRARINEIVLLDNEIGQWRVRNRFELAEA